MNAEQPFFRFNPNAYREGRSLKPSSDTCDVCSQPCGWKYVGVIYDPTSPTVCARCIAGARLGTFLGRDDFTLHDISLEGADPELAREVLQRTPGVACFNPFAWPVLDGKPLAFVGYGDEKDLYAIPAVRTAMNEAFGKWAADYGASTYALIFKDLDGERYEVVIDLD